MVFPTFFNFSLNLAIRSSWSEPQSPPGLVFASPSLAAKNIINLISVLTIWWCPCVVFCAVGRGCLLLSVHSLGKTLLAFGLLILYSKPKLACYSRYLLTSYFCIPVPYDEKDIFFFFFFFGVLVLENVLGYHRAIKLQLLQHYWSGHRLGLLWYWMVCFGNEQRPFCHFWDCTQVLHFGLSCSDDYLVLKIVLGWVGQKVCFGFSVRYYRKIWMNFFG